MTGIFVESTNELGLLYNRYKDVPEITEKFIDEVDGHLDEKNGDAVVGDKLERFKSIVRGVMRSPEPINPRTTDKERKKVQDARNKTEKLVTKLANLYEKCEAKKANENMTASRTRSAINWIKKVIIDTLNLCDQDLNILSLVNKVYYKKIYESDCSQMMTDGDDSDDYMISEISGPEDIFESVYDRFLDEYISEKGKSIVDPGINDLMSEIPEDDKREYFPIFPMAVSYNPGQLYTAMGVVINKVTNGDRYTHAFMSFDPEFKTIMTYGGKKLEYMQVEDYEAFKYSKSVYVSVVWLTKSEINDIKKTIKEYISHPEEVRFSLMNFFTMMMGKAKRKDKSHCCSAFLGYLLNVANKKNLMRDYSEIRPEDVTLLPRAFYVGTFSDLEDLKKKRPEFKKRIQQLYDDNIDDIREYNNSIPKVMLTDNIKKPKELSSFYKNIVSKHINLE